MGKCRKAWKSRNTKNSEQKTEKERRNAGKLKREIGKREQKLKNAEQSKGRRKKMKRMKMSSLPQGKTNFSKKKNKKKFLVFILIGPTWEKDLTPVFGSPDVTCQAYPSFSETFLSITGIWGTIRYIFSSIILEKL